MRYRATFTDRDTLEVTLQIEFTEEDVNFNGERILDIVQCQIAAGPDAEYGNDIVKLECGSHAKCR